VVIELLPVAVLSQEESDKEEPFDKEVESPLPLPLGLSSSVKEEEDSLLRRLRVFFDFFDFFGLLRDLDCVDETVRLLFPVLALTEPFPWVVMPSSLLESDKSWVETTTLVPALTVAAAAAPLWRHRRARRPACRRRLGRRSGHQW
jgi:hypothetical protein